MASVLTFDPSEGEPVRRREFEDYVHGEKAYAKRNYNVNGYTIRAMRLQAMNHLFVKDMLKYTTYAKNW